MQLSISKTTGSSFRFVVEDNGIGIEEDKIDDLFQSFKQAEDPTTREFGGTGLGLTIVKNLVDLLDGKISVKSVLNEGSEFTVEIPADVIGKPSQTYNLSGLNIHALLDDGIVQSAFQSFLDFEGTSLQIHAVEKDLCEAAMTSPDGTVVILALPSIEEMNRIKATLSGGNNQLDFVMLVYDSDALSDCTETDCVRVLRGPLVPSELQHALVSLKTNRQKKTEIRYAKAKLSKDDSKDGKVVLLVEDNRINQEVIATQLKHLGYRVALASDGQEGLDKWKAGEFSLVLSDCHMPVMDGYEMAQSIRASEAMQKRSRTPIVAITANALKGEAEKCYAAGMDGYLSKPVALEDIRQELLRHTEEDTADT